MKRASKSRRKLTPKQRVLKRHPQAFCKVMWPGVWFVMPSARAAESLNTGGRAAAEAWAKAARGK